jgi:dTDP-4-dehydrorhamnose reductase
MRILVLGRKGQLGRCLKDQLVNTHHEVIYTSREQINIANFEATEHSITEIYPDVIINATAYTAVDKAEQEEKVANLTNNFAVENIAKICLKINSILLHISTDYVFDGTLRKPYDEFARTNPQGVYGKSKLDGEIAIQKSGCKHVIIRTSWVFSEYGNNFVKTMLRLAREKDSLSIVSDQIGCPTYAGDLASFILGFIELRNIFDEKVYGIYHFSGDLSLSWFQFAEEIFTCQKKLCNDFKIPRLIKLKTAEYPTLAKRPKYSVMCSKRNIEPLKTSVSNWKVSLEHVLKRLKN